MRRVAITNQKGGVGKTTTTVNLAAALGRRGQRVLLVDLDPQSHLTTHFGLDGNNGPGTYELLTEQTPVEKMLLPSEPGLTVIPSRMDLAAAESELISVVGREAILRDRLAALNGRYDWLLIDCPPSFGVLTLNALSTVDEVLVPLQAHFLGLQGVGKLLETVNLVGQRINPALRVAGFVLCMYESGTKLAKEVVDDLQRFLTDARGQAVAWRDARIFAARIRRNIKLAECPSYGQSIFAYAPESHGALDYVALAEELLGAPAATADARTESAAASRRAADENATTESSECRDTSAQRPVPSAKASSSPLTDAETRCDAANSRATKAAARSERRDVPAAAEQAAARSVRRKPVGAAATNLPSQASANATPAAEAPVAAPTPIARTPKKPLPPSDGVPAPTQVPRKSPQAVGRGPETRPRAAAVHKEPKAAAKQPDPGVAAGHAEVVSKTPGPTAPPPAPVESVRPRTEKPKPARPSNPAGATAHAENAIAEINRPDNANDTPGDEISHPTPEVPVPVAAG